MQFDLGDTPVVGKVLRAGVSTSPSAGNGKDDLPTWATCSPLTVSGSPGSRAYQTRRSKPRMAQWRRITRDETYPRYTDALRPCGRGNLKKVRVRERGKVSGGGREKRGGKRDFLNHSLLFQPDSEFGRSVDILRILVRTISGWSSCSSSTLLVRLRLGETPQSTGWHVRV